MKNSSNSSRRLIITILAATGCLGLSLMTAPADIYLFNNGAGGDGVWENGTPTTPPPTLWSDGATQNLPWDNSVLNDAYFTADGGGNATAGGTVNVASDVTADYLRFSTTSDETLDGTGTITVVTSNGVLENDTNSNVTIDNNINIDASQDTDRFDIGDGGANTLTLNGDITYTGSLVRPGGIALIFNGGADTNFVLGGAFNSSATVPARIVLGSGTIHLNGNYTNANHNSLLEVDSGTAYLGSSTLGMGEIDLLGGAGSVTSVYTTGAQTISNSVSAQNYNYGSDPNNAEGHTTFVSGEVVVGGSTADLSTYRNVSAVVTGITASAVQDGRVDFDSGTGASSLSGSISYGLTKTGAGTVVLADGNNYNLGHYNAPDGTIAADIQQGTLLINNPVLTSAFGNNSGAVEIEAGATLGGTGHILPSGSSNQTVVAMSGASIIAPGDAGQSNLNINPVIGILHLEGGLTTTTHNVTDSVTHAVTAVANGLTLDFKLGGPGADAIPVAGVDNDAIDMGPGSLTLNGPITVNFTVIGPVATGVVYTLMTGYGDWTGSTSPSFDIMAPAGYALDQSYNGTGYDFDTNSNGDSLNNFTGESFTVQFVAVPEPSTYGLMGLGLLALVAIGRFRRLNA